MKFDSRIDGWRNLIDWFGWRARFRWHWHVIIPLVDDIDTDVRTLYTPDLLRPSELYRYLHGSFWVGVRSDSRLALTRAWSTESFHFNFQRADADRHGTTPTAPRLCPRFRGWRIWDIHLTWADSSVSCRTILPPNSDPQSASTARGLWALWQTSQGLFLKNLACLITNFKIFGRLSWMFNKL